MTTTKLTSHWVAVTCRCLGTRDRDSSFGNERLCFSPHKNNLQRKQEAHCKSDCFYKIPRNTNQTQRRSEKTEPIKITQHSYKTRAGWYYDINLMIKKCHNTLLWDIMISFSWHFNFSLLNNYKLTWSFIFSLVQC